MSFVIEVENIKCGGCANSIRNKLLDDARVSEVEVEIEAGQVRVEAAESARTDLTAALAKMGYPERGSVEGLQAAAAKAKSFVACAVGRMDGGKD